MTSPIIAPSRRLRRTPFSPRVEAAGVKGFTVYNHMLLPTAFVSVEDDYRHLKDHVQVWDVSCERQVEIKGPDAARLVQLMTPRDLGKARVGRCFYVPLVDETGGMINDPVALKLAEDRFWLSIADSDVVLWGKGLAAGMGLDVSVEEPDVSPLGVQGPKADDLVAGVFGEAVRDIRFFGFATLDFRGHPLIVARSGWSKQGGFEIYLDDFSLGLDLWDALMEAGKELNARAGCPNLIERIEGGLLSYGNDMTYENNPFECGLDKFCNLDAPTEFLGRDALQTVHDKGPDRLIKGIRMDGEPVPACVETWPVTAAGANAGILTSAAYSPDLGTNVAFAMLERGHWDVGHQVEVETPAGTRPGTVVDLPFI